MSFSVAQFGEVLAVVYEPWRMRGIGHGFTLAPADFGAHGVERWGRELALALGYERVELLHQVHGDVCCAVESRSGDAGKPQEGDAFAWERGGDFRGVFGVKAADCVPILGYSEECRFAIHAGWRGLAGGIIERVFERSGAARCEWVIGPCAGPVGYEVGGEVLTAIGSCAVAQPTGAGEKFELDLARTAEQIIRRLTSEARVAVIGINTVVDRRFHSHRRDGAAAGRGLGFFIV